VSNYSLIPSPPPELVEQWRKGGPSYAIANNAYEHYIATQAARWGADQELEACDEWLFKDGYDVTSARLRAARRPKPPSLKEQALAVLDHTQKGYGLAEVDLDTIRRALEQLND
jgi:hypothetical protein